MRHAVLKNNIVQNITVLEADGDWMPGIGFTAVPIGDDVVDIGWIYSNGVFLPPPPPETTISDEAYNQLQKAARNDAYSDEADPLFFKWQRDEATHQDWLDKIEEIKNRFPYRGI